MNQPQQQNGPDLTGQSPIGIVNFPAVFVPKKVQETDKEAKYSVTLAFYPNRPDWVAKHPKQMELFNQLVEHANAAAMHRFGMPLKDPQGNPSIANGKAKPMSNPFRRGTESKSYDDDCVFVRFASKNPPGVVDIGKNDIPRDSGETIVYSGCWGRVLYKAATFDYMGNWGVNFWVNVFQKTGDGQRIQRGASADGFDDLPMEDMGQPAPMPVAAQIAQGQQQPAYPQGQPQQAYPQGQPQPAYPQGQPQPAYPQGQPAAAPQQPAQPLPGNPTQF